MELLRGLGGGAGVAPPPAAGRAVAGGGAGTVPPWLGALPPLLRAPVG